MALGVQEIIKEHTHLVERERERERERDPADTRIISGLNLCAAGTIISWKTVDIASSPEPPGSGKFNVAPSPASFPISSNFPVPG